ncbi:hypothetical protein [Streptomyces sp. P17]|uniref:hypothetical protein n=1 Tax=Streptomyces sp. P17 TaxID=3074716 RepID=UPI0028F40747|nr:hypothetical protein [Streptomyces sp. P17]MDT9701390.1 hypothetical protein [Streptomyces sp. P17]
MTGHCDGHFEEQLRDDCNDEDHREQNSGLGQQKCADGEPDTADHGEDEENSRHQYGRHHEEHHS